jgi:hypothetical protein
MSMENIERLNELCKELKIFIGSRAHIIYKSNTQRDLDVVQERIMDDELTDIKDIFSLLDYRGQRKVLQANISLFEDTLATLESRVQELLTRETEAQVNNETTND